MPLLLSAALFVVGLLCIIKGGDLFVDAARWISERTGIPRLVIGATVVSLATTLPELVVSLTASFKGSAGIAIGNVVGSAAANTGLILGLSIALLPAVLQRAAFAPRALLLMASTAALWLLSLDGRIGLWESLVLFALLALFFVVNVRAALAAGRGRRREPAGSSQSQAGRQLLGFVLGVGGIVLGAQLLVDNGRRLALHLGVPEAVVGLTIVAVGTSLPELVTTLTAVRKGESALSIGNIIGANIIDITLILPLCSLVSPAGLQITPQTLRLDLPVTLFIIAVAVIPGILFQKLTRPQGLLLLALYAGYVCVFTGLAPLPIPMG